MIDLESYSVVWGADSETRVEIARCATWSRWRNG